MNQDKINVSVGTVGVLGLDHVPMETAPTTAYLMLGGRCAMNCAFCAQARESEANALYLSRVTWPEYDLAAVSGALAEAVGRGDIRRACIQVTVGDESFRETMDAVRVLRQAVPDLALDVAILPGDMEQTDALLSAGVDHIGIGLDAASRAVFERVKGHRWDRVLALIEGAARRHPGRVAVHLIVGLGESEREAVELIQRLDDWGITVGLFAFTPVRGTPLGSTCPPPLSTYRRVQVARHLIGVKHIRMDRFVFSSTGRLLDFEVEDLSALLADGEAFRTSGCPDCNRPFYNERPGGVMYNYPRPLTPQEVDTALADLDLVS